MGWILAFVAVWVVTALLSRYVRKKGARELVEMVRQLNAGRHEYRDADPARFPHLDLRFYDETARLLEREGFVRLGDREDVTLNEAPGTATAPLFIRELTGEGGRILVGIFHLRPIGWQARLARLQGGAKPVRGVEFQTDLSDGTYLTTSNATAARAMSRPPQILADHLPSGCTPLEVLEAHRRRLADYLAEHPEVEVLPITTMAQAIELDHRIHDLMMEYRRSKGGLEPEEVLRVGDGSREARRLAKEVEKLRDLEGGKPQ